jgi:hypothetical protein
MSQNFLFNASFHLLLIKVDQELAEHVQQQGCPYCRGWLHLANYPRSPLGMPPAFRNNYEERFSFCCDTCRKRTTPPSVRFFGRRWYPAPLFIFISALTFGANLRRLASVKQHFNIVVSGATWRRWREWWNKSFLNTSFWQQAKGQLPPMPAILQGPFPRKLLKVFQGGVKEKIIWSLQFLSPLTGGFLRAV